MTTKKPFFSIIIPTLNEARFLPRLLENLVAQKEKDFEVFVIDGQGDDQTIIKAQAFSSRLPLKVIQTEKRNVSYQRNLGGKKASGHYLLFLDADVQVSAGFLGALKRKCIQYSFDLGTTYTKADSTEVNDRMISTFYNIAYEAAGILEKPFIPGFNFIVTKAVFEKEHGFDEKVVHGEDYELSTRLYSKGYDYRLLRAPQIIQSLRRYRAEGRAAVIRKNIVATLHFFTKGNIEKNLFSYPMGGGWYTNTLQKKRETFRLQKAERYFRKFRQLIFE